MERASAIVRSTSVAINLTLIGYILSLIMIGGVVMYVDMPKPMTFVTIVGSAVLLLTPFIVAINCSQDANSYLRKLMWFEKIQSCDEKTLAWIERMLKAPREEWRKLEFSGREVTYKVEGHAFTYANMPMLPDDLWMKEFELALLATRNAIMERMQKEEAPSIPATLVRWERYVMRQAMA